MGGGEGEERERSVFIKPLVDSLPLHMCLKLSEPSRQMCVLSQTAGCVVWLSVVGGLY